jgi:hypothetical protein
MKRDSGLAHSKVPEAGRGGASSPGTDAKRGALGPGRNHDALRECRGIQQPSLQGRESECLHPLLYSALRQLLFLSARSRLWRGPHPLLLLLAVSCRYSLTPNAGSPPVCAQRGLPFVWERKAMKAHSSNCPPSMMIVQPVTYEAASEAK